MDDRAEQRLAMPDAFAVLTGKQHQVLCLVAENHTSKQIAFRLGISESAVNQRIESVRNRVGSLPRAELARAYRQYLQDIESGAAPARRVTSPVRLAENRRHGGLVRTVAMAAGLLVLATFSAGMAGRRPFLSGFSAR